MVIVIAVVVAFGATLVAGNTPVWAGLLYGVLSALCFVVYAVDKSAAVAGRWRISENTLLGLGLLGGWPGAILAQQVFRHKIRKRRYMLVFAGTVVANVGVLILVLSPIGAPIREAIVSTVV